MEEEPRIMDYRILEERIEKLEQNQALIIGILTDYHSKDDSWHTEIVYGNVEKLIAWG